MPNVLDTPRTIMQDLFMSWVSEGTGGKHQLVPDDVLADATTYAKAALEEDDSDSDSDDDDN